MSIKRRAKQCVNSWQVKFRRGSRKKRDPFFEPRGLRCSVTKPQSLWTTLLLYTFLPASERITLLHVFCLVLLLMKIVTRIQFKFYQKCWIWEISHQKKREASDVPTLILLGSGRSWGPFCSRLKSSPAEDISVFIIKKNKDPWRFYSKYYIYILGNLFLFSGFCFFSQQEWHRNWKKKQKNFSGRISSKISMTSWFFTSTDSHFWMSRKLAAVALHENWTKNVVCCI